MTTHLTSSVFISSGLIAADKGTEGASGRQEWRASDIAQSGSTACWHSRTITDAAASNWHTATSAISGCGGPAAMAGSLGGGSRLVSLQELPFDTLAAYEQNFFPASRLDFVQSWMSQPKTVALGLMGFERLLGYGVRRSCRSGYKIGPLFADSPELAATLLDALCAGTEVEAPLFLDVPECNRDAVALADARGMHRVFETARMYTGAAPDLALARSYGITNFEVG